MLGVVASLVFLSLSFWVLRSNSYGSNTYDVASSDLCLQASNCAGCLDHAAQCGFCLPSGDVGGSCVAKTVGGK